MKACDVLEHFKSVGTWVDWADTCDGFLHGDPEAEVAGMVAAWIPTTMAIEEAAARGANLIVTHEPAFFTERLYREHPASRRVAEARRALLDELGITLLRCHDTWDRMPGVGIPAAWARWLGFPVVDPDESSFYRLLDVSGHTVKSLARKILEKTRPLGQDVVLVYGDRSREVSRMGVGTGAITRLPLMAELGADVCLGTDDGCNAWNAGLWALDSDTPTLLVHHAVAELPGMRALAEHLDGKFPVKTSYVPVAFPYSSVR